MKMSLLPLEIIEMILWYCSGTTLLAARDVCEDWRNIVDGLTKKSQGLYKTCNEVIPKKELGQYLEQHDTENLRTWAYIYKKWIASADIAKTQLQAVQKLSEKSPITCINTFKNYIAVGLEDGSVKIFDQDWQLMHTKKYLPEPVDQVDFMYSTEKCVSNLKIVVKHATSELFIGDLLLTDSKVLIVEGVTRHSVYKDHICIMIIAFITVRKLNSVLNETSLETIYNTRSYNPSNIRCLKMWNGTGTILINNEVRRIDYYQPNDCFPKLFLKNYTTPQSELSSAPHVFRDDVLILVDHLDGLGQQIEIIVLENEPEPIRNIFKSNKIFKGNITCVYLYGNTLTFGLDSGYAYFYHVSSWNDFSLGKDFNEIFIDSHPIQDIIVKEGQEQRSYLITTKVNVFEVLEEESALASHTEL